MRIRLRVATMTAAALATTMSGADAGNYVVSVTNATGTVTSAMDLRRYEADYAGNAVPSATIELTTKLMHTTDQRIVASRTFLQREHSSGVRRGRQVSERHARDAGPPGRPSRGPCRGSRGSPSGPPR